MENRERKCIAVLISKPERKYQEGLLHGICKSAFARGANVAVFATSLLEGMEEYRWGEQEIFDLIQFDKIAGVVYAVGSFYDNEFSKTLSAKMQEIAASGIPVVAVDGEVEGIPCYFNDDANAIQDILDHLITEHGVEDIAFMTGREGHPHAENALQAYRKAMAEHGFRVFSDRICYGDYWYNESENFVKKLQASVNGLPEAIVCANEYMAIGVYRALHARGVFVPKNILLACTANDSTNVPYLLVGENSMENVGFEAVEKIFRVLDGEEMQGEVRFFPCKNKLCTSVGCGCQKASAYDYSKERGVLIDTDPGYYGECNFYREGMLSKKDFTSLFQTFDEHTRYIEGFRELHMCMCDGWDSPAFLIGDTRRNPYTDRMQLYYSRRETPEGPDVYIGEDRFFAKEEMFPTLFQEEGEPVIYLFRALHFLDRNFGYVVINNGQKSKIYDFVFNFWLHDVTNALESQCRLQSVNYMFYTDIMTGLYSRNGYNTMLPTILSDSVEQGKKILVALADLNGLKKINDTFGHEEGDAAIQAAALLLKQQTVEGAVYEKNFRIGGDEFVKIAIGDFTSEKLDQFKESLYARVAEYSGKAGKSYKTEMSLGYCCGKVDTMEALEALQAEADTRMYVEKMRLKGMNS